MSVAMPTPSDFQVDAIATATLKVVVLANRAILGITFAAAVPADEDRVLPRIECAGFHLLILAFRSVCGYRPRL
jgi:hypothetical protein